MGIVFRQSVKTSLVLFLGAMLGAIILWLSTRYIPKQEYGFTKSMTNWAVMLSTFAPIGLNSTLAVFIHRYNNDHVKRKLLLTICFAIPLVITALIAILYLLVPEWVIHHFQPEDALLMRTYYSWLPIYILFLVYMTMFDQYLCSQMKVAVSYFMKEVLLRILNILFILLFVFNIISFHTLVMASILIYSAPLFMYVVLAFNTKGFGFTTNLSGFSTAEYKEVAHFSWYHFLLYISIMLLNSMDALLIPFYDHKGFATLAVYVVAVYFISLAYMPSKAFTQASFAAFAKAFNNESLGEAKDIFIRSSINLLIPTVGIALIICCNLENVVSIIGSGKNYSGLIPVFIVLLMGMLVNVANGMTDQVLSITNYYKFNFYVSLIISAILFGLIRFLVPRYGIFGAACASSLAMILYNITKFLFVWKKLDMQAFSANTLKTLICGLPALAGGYFFPYFFNPDRHVYVHTFLDAIMRSGVILIIYVIMLVWLKPSKDLEHYLAAIKKDKRLF